MKKRILSVIMVLCLAFSLVPITAGAAGVEMMQLGTEMKKSWSAMTDDCLYLVEITEPGFYDLTITDYKGDGQVGVSFLNDENYDLYYQYYVSHAFYKDSSSNRYTYKNLYLNKGIIEIRCSYVDADYIGLDASIGLTLTHNEDYSPEELSSNASYVSIEPDEITSLSYRTAEAGDYILKCSQKTDSFLHVINKDTLETETFINFFGSNAGYRLNLKANTEYMLQCMPLSSDSKVTKVSMSKADKDVTNISLASTPEIIPDSTEYGIQQNSTYRISYSDNTFRIAGYDEIASSDECFDLDLAYEGEYNDAVTDNDPLLATGQQSVKLSYLNKESYSSISVIPFTEFVSDLTPVVEYADMSVTYEDDLYKTYYWHVRPDVSGYYGLHSYDGWDTTFGDYDFEVFDEADNYVKWNNSEFYLKGGHDYCLRFTYVFDTDEATTFAFWLERTDTELVPDAPSLKITTSSGHPKVTWSKVDGAAKYWIYRSTDGKNFKYYDSTTGTSYTNMSTTVGTTYYYKVKAVTSSGTASDFSNTVSVKCVPSSTTVSMSRVNGKPKLTWKAVSGATKYWVYRSTDGKNFSVYTTVTGTSYTNSGAASGTKYYYKVKAVKTVNGTNAVSASSNTVSLITTLASPSVKITTVSGHPKITWSKVTGATKYWIYRSTDGKNFKYYDSTTATSYTNMSTNVGTTYYYKVKAVCGENSNANSALSTAKSIKCVPASTTVSITSSNGKPKVTWDKVDGATKYWLYRSTDGKNFNYYDSTTGTSYTNSGAKAGTTYYYKVKAVKVVNGTSVSSAFSNTVSLKAK